MSRWSATPLKGHLIEVSTRKGDIPAEVLSVTNTDGFVRSLEVFDKQVFSQDTSNYKLVRFDDLAYNPSRINVGSVARCHFPEGGAVSPMYVVVQCRKSLLPQFLLYFLKSDIGKQHINHRCVGAVRFQLRTCLIDAMFHEMFGDPLTNPKRWNVTTIAELTSFITSGSRGWAEHYSDRGARFIRVQNLAGHRLSLDDVALIDPPNTVEAKRTRIQPDDLLLAITGNTIGLSALAPEDIGEAYVSQHVAIVRLNEKAVPVFIACFMALSRGGQYRIAEMQYGHTKPGISLQQIRDIPVPLPPLPRQENFANRIAEIRALESAQAASRKKLDDLFQSLLHRAFQGKL